jgi:hypothetical protein
LFVQPFQDAQIHFVICISFCFHSIFFSFEICSSLSNNKSSTNFLISIYQYIKRTNVRKKQYNQYSQWNLCVIVCVCQFE